MNNSLLSFIGIEGTKKILQMYFSVEMSEQFLNCLDTQLTKIFIEDTGIKIKPPIWMGWEKEKGLTYSKGLNSKISAQIHLQHGVVELLILWKSKSGRIYEMADTDIACDDIEFWFEGLDPELCRNYLNPKWSLFTIETFKNTYIDQFKLHAIDASYDFLKCADEQLTVQFVKLTGLKITHQVRLLVLPDKIVSVWRGNEAAEYIPRPPILEAGLVSKLTLNLSVFAHSNPVIILWKSKSGRIYKMSDKDINCNDIEFWFDKLDTESYIDQYYPKGQKLPFVVKDLPYELVVKRLDINCTVSITVMEDQSNRREDIIETLNAFTKKFNDVSEKKTEQGEVIRNYLGKATGDSMIVLEIDMSLAGFDYLKKLLKQLSKVKGTTTVEIA